jgi:hypothetical protein
MMYTNLKDVKIKAFCTRMQVRGQSPNYFIPNIKQAVHTTST